MHILCTICSDLVNHAENIHITKCGHIFHYHCLSQWIERSKSCPQCRNRVTEKCMFRIYPTISNENSSEDVATLQSRLDNAQLQLRQQAATCREKDEKLTAVTTELTKKEEALKSSEKKLASRDSVVAALKEQLDYVKIQNKETQKLKEENEVLKKNLQTLTGLQKVLNATSDEVEEMLQGYTDVRTIATFATALKRALCESESKKNECRDRLQAVKQQLAAEKLNCADWQAKYVQVQENLAIAERKYESLKNKRKASDVLDKSILDDSWPQCSPKLKRRTDPESLFNDTIVRNESDASFNTMVNKIENADSPYLNLKQSSLALAALQRPTISGGEIKLKPSEFAMLNSVKNIKKTGSENMPSNSQNYNHSIFHRKNPGVVNLSEENTDFEIPDLNVSYDGLGGHSKIDKFPTWKPVSKVPKLNAKHKLKKPNTTGIQDIGAMLARIPNK